MHLQVSPENQDFLQEKTSPGIAIGERGIQTDGRVLSVHVHPQGAMILSVTQWILIAIMMSRREADVHFPEQIAIAEEETLKMRSMKVEKVSTA